MTLHNHTQPGRSAAPQPPADPQEHAEYDITVISHQEMDTAHAQGLVRCIGDTLGPLVRYQQRWWLRFERGWIKTDPPLSAALDQQAGLLAGQDAIVARNAAKRRSAGSTPTGHDEQDRRDNR